MRRLEAEIDVVHKHLANLTQLRIKDLIFDQEYEAQRGELLSQIAQLV